MFNEKKFTTQFYLDVFEGVSDFSSALGGSEAGLVSDADGVVTVVAGVSAAVVVGAGAGAGAVWATGLGYKFHNACF